MRYRAKLILFSGILLVLVCCCFGWLKEQCAAPVPEPSVPGGYYAEEFILKLQAPSNGKIYYTTDGSTPTTDSALYHDGIRICNRSHEPNIYNSIQNIITNWESYAPDSTPVEKGTVIRALYVNDWGMESGILTQTYFVGLSKPHRGYTLSLVFEKEDLFGENGIYVTGQEYDDWYLSGNQNAAAPLPNFEKRTEVTAIAELMGADGEVMNQAVSLRLQGASARGLAKKRFILESQAELSESNLFPVAVFPDVSTHSIMTKEFPADALVHDLISDRSVASQKSVPVRLYLNGEFWQNCYMLERYDNQYFRQQYGVEDVILVKSGVVDEDVIDQNAYGELMYWVEHTDFSDEANWNQLQQEVDIQSYIDFIAVNYYLCNFDFNDFKNHLMWRSAVIEKSSYADTRWRWCIYDIDPIQFALARFDVENAAEINIFSCVLPHSDVRVNETVFFHALHDQPQFRRMFVLSFMDIVNNNFAIDKVTSVLNKNGLPNDWMDGFFLKRPAYAAQHLADEFQLTGTLETVSIHASNPDMGNVMVNTSSIDLSSGSWTGSYFTDYPITVTALANDGYEFLGWKGDADSTDSTITLPVDGGIMLEPLFAKIK